MNVARFSRGTVIFIAISAVAFVIDLLLPGRLLLWGAKSHAIWAGEWYRLLSANFIHSGVTHILFNMYALFIFGSIVENLAGRRGFFAVYLIGGASGFIASLLALPETLSVGASASVFALMGYTIHYRLRRLPMRWLPMDTSFLQILGLNIIMAFAVPNIDHFAHIGGFVGGFFTAGVLGLPPSQFTHPREATPLVERLFAAVMIALFFWGGLAPLSVGATLTEVAPGAQRTIQQRYERYFATFLVADATVLWRDPTTGNQWSPVGERLRRPSDSSIDVATFWRWSRGGGAGAQSSFRVIWERHMSTLGWQVVHVDQGFTREADPSVGLIYRRSGLAGQKADELAGDWRITVEVDGKTQYRTDFTIIPTSII